MIIPAHWARPAKQEGASRIRQRVSGRSSDRHNNYLTLPWSSRCWPATSHSRSGSSAPGSFCSRFALVVAIRHFFNLWHTGQRPWWILGAAAAGGSALAFALAPDDTPVTAAPNDSVAQSIVAERCQTCHSGASAPLGVQLESLAQMEQHAGQIEVMVSSRAMPPGNTTGLTDTERDQLVAWAAAHG